MSLSLTSTAKLPSGHLIPLLGFGVYQNFTTKDSVLHALAAGYRHIDSAQAYRNEVAVGAAVRESALPRTDIFITTKVATKAHGYATTLKAVDDSLARFEFDYIDLFLIHDPFAGTERRLATYKALQDAKQAGKIKSVGVSNLCVPPLSKAGSTNSFPPSGVKHLEEIRNAGFDTPSINQIEIHPFCQQRPIVAYCRDHAIAVQAYCPLLRGKMDHPTISELADKHNRSPAQILLRWSLQSGFIPLPKSATPSRIRANTQLYDFSLPADDMAKLDALDRGKEGAISWNPVDTD